MRVVLTGAIVASGFALFATGATGATFPGANGKIAFVRVDDPGVRHLYAMDPDGQNQTQLTFGDSLRPRDPSWSGDGERLAFQGQGASGSTDDAEIFVIDHDGQNLTQLTSNSVADNMPSFSPDGHSIAFMRVVGGDSEIFVMDANGQGVVQLTDNAITDQAPNFSPNGQRIVFARGAEEGGGDILVIDADGQNETPLTTGPAVDGFPAWSPDGQRILFTRYSGLDADLYVMDSDGQNQVPLVTGPQVDQFGQFSPDAQQITFVGLAGSGNEIFVADASGANPMPLTDNPVDEESPDWQPLNPPACDLSGPPKQTSFRAVAATITCAENATVAASGEGKAPKAPTLASTSKAKRFTLEPTTVEVPQNQPTTLTLKVPKKGKKALKKAAKAGKKGKATVTTTATDDFGETTQDSLAVKFKRKKKK